MGQNEKASAGGTAEAKGYDNDDLNKSSANTSKGANRKQQQSSAERLFDLTLETAS